MKKNKNYFIFRYFDDLKVGDVFKFSPLLDDDIPSCFFTVYNIAGETVSINSTYGKKIVRFDYPTNLNREVMIFPDRKR